MSARLLLKGGRVVDPSQGIDDTLDVLLGEAGVEELGARLAARGATVVDVAGLVVCPGFIDLRTHLGEPGHEDRETVRTGTRAAAAGGFTAVCAMPGSDPVNDHAGITRALLDRARLEGITRVYPVGALSRGLRGEELAEYGDLREAGLRGGGRRRAAGPERSPSPPRPRVREGLRPRGDRLLRGADPRGEGGHERGPGGHPPRPAGKPRGGGVAGGRARPPARRAHLGPAARGPRLDRGLGGRDPAGEGPRRPGHRGGDPPSPAPDRPAGEGPRVRHRGQGEAAPARRKTTAARWSRACATAPSTASPPTTRPTPWTTRRSSSTRPRSGSRRWRRRWPWASTASSTRASSSSSSWWPSSPRIRRRPSASPAAASGRVRPRT